MMILMTCLARFCQTDIYCKFGCDRFFMFLKVSWASLCICWKMSSRIWCNLLAQPKLVNSVYILYFWFGANTWSKWMNKVFVYTLFYYGILELCLRFWCGRRAHLFWMINKYDCCSIRLHLRSRHFRHLMRCWKNRRNQCWWTSMLLGNAIFVCFAFVPRIILMSFSVCITVVVKCASQEHLTSHFSLFKVVVARKLCIIYGEIN